MRVWKLPKPTPTWNRALVVYLGDHDGRFDDHLDYVFDGTPVDLSGDVLSFFSWATIDSLPLSSLKEVRMFRSKP
jgi:hypothetical protein